MLRTWMQFPSSRVSLLVMLSNATAPFLRALHLSVLDMGASSVSVGQDGESLSHTYEGAHQQAPNAAMQVPSNAQASTLTTMALCC